MPVLNKLTDQQIRKTKTRSRAFKLFDGGGLYLHILPGGTRSFRYAYRSPITGRVSDIFIGHYGRHVDEVTLANARERHRQLRAEVLNGVDPGEERRDRRRRREEYAGSTLQAVAEDFFTIKKDDWVIGNYRRVVSRMELHVYADLGERHVSSLRTPEIRALLLRIQDMHTPETANRVRQTLSQVFRHAVNIGLIEHDPAATLHGTLKKARSSHFAAVTNKSEIGGLLRAIDGYTGQPHVQIALRLLPLTMLRVGEFRQAEWENLDLPNRVLIIPADRMKGTKARKMNAPPHCVPLSDQSIALINELKSITGRHQWLFHSSRLRNRPLSDATLSAAIAEIGYKGRQTGHGFRATASTLLNESGLFRPDAIERQLAHQDKNRVRAAYDRSEHWEERVRMMQWLANEYDGLKKMHSSISP